MLIVYWTMKSDKPGVFYDFYSLAETEEQARKFFDELLERPSTCSAGIAVILDSSDHRHIA